MNGVSTAFGCLQLVEAASENNQIGKNEAIEEEFYGFAWSMD